ncbi:MAG: tetratricopeptide repeat protein [Sphingobacteriales bacterium]|nr:MAG: tetratricopeptide repeat protein [Sphingobacteriales bacterium]
MRYFSILLSCLLLTGAGLRVSAQSPALPETNTLKANNLFLDGIRARTKSNSQEAATLFQQYTALRPDDGAGWYERARLSLKDSKAVKAEEYIRKAIALDPDNKWYRYFEADVLTLQGKYEAAAEVYESVARANPNDAENLIKSALLFQRVKNYPKALEQLDKALSKMPGDEELLLQKQQVYLKANQVDKALDISRQLIATNPREPRYRVQLGQVYESNQKLPEAFAAYQEAEKLFPNDPLVQLSLADYYRKTKNEEQYKSYLRKAITNKGLDAETQISLLMPYLQEMAQDTARRAEGVEMAAQLAVQHPRDAQLQLFYGELLLMTGKGSDASAQFRKVVELDPSKFPAWEQLMYSYTAPQDADSLIATSERALRLFPTQAVAHYLNGIGYQNKKAYPKAVKALQRGIDLQPEEDENQLAQMYVSLGDTYNMMKEYVQSDTAYETALRLNPENATVLNNYAYYLSVRKARLKDAEAMSKKSLELRPDEGTFLDTYGWILYQQGSYKDARTYIQRAIDQAAGEADGTLYDHLGDVLYRLGEKTKAVDAWKKAQQKGADNATLPKKIAESKLYE